MVENKVELPNEESLAFALSFALLNGQKETCIFISTKADLFIEKNYVLFLKSALSHSLNTCKWVYYQYKAKGIIEISSTALSDLLMQVVNKYDIKLFAWFWATYPIYGEKDKVKKYSYILDSLWGIWDKLDNWMLSKGYEPSDISAFNPKVGFYDD